MRVKALTALAFLMAVSGCQTAHHDSAEFNPKRDSESVAECYGAYHNLGSEEGAKKIAPYAEKVADAIGNQKFYERAYKVGFDMGGGILTVPAAGSVGDRKRAYKYNLSAARRCDRLIKSWEHPTGL